ncbi:MAG: type II toxin-antitoxin system prevent-host-death family antitoxin [Candidatus Nanopelagicales bacterium]|jgi:prevent-host-death family protein|nr:type II toxin-antitoxin system prevent-host-death family antitoxin [Actinomycetota bacterium]HRY11882.1 type II toxin-antitoxin system prevent-host-death family antitoxin [Candidatus Nanopelagicales bacterium]
MAEVSIRELRNEGGSVVERVLRGELITITRSGAPVATLQPIGRVPLNSRELVDRWRRVPVVDIEALRSDVDYVLDTRL